MSTFRERLWEDLAATDSTDLVLTYFADDGPTAGYTGRMFERWRSTNEPYRITLDDLAAVSALSIKIPVRTAMQILDNGEVPRILRELPNSEVGDPDVRPDHVLPRLGALSDELRQYDEMGPTTTTKLIAAKRPGLAPVYDSVVEGRLAPPRGKFYQSMYDSWYWSADDKLRIADLAEQIRTDARQASHDVPSDLTLLRTIDVVIWMRHHPRTS